MLLANEKRATNVMKAISRILNRAFVVATAIAIFCQGCVLSAQHSAFRPIHSYAKAGDVEHVAEELAKDPHVLNLPDDSGFTPLHLAAARCRTNVVEFLLEKGADVERKSKDGSRPLHLAAQEGCTNVVTMLLARKAKINARDDQGRTPLKRAADWGQNSTVEFLRQRGGTE